MNESLSPTAKFQREIKIQTVREKAQDFDENEKYTFYSQLQDILNSVNKGDIYLVLGYFIAKVDTDSNLWAGVLGPFGIGCSNGNGDHLLQKLRTDAVGQIDRKLGELVDDLITEVEGQLDFSHSDNSFSSNSTNGSKVPANRELPEKEFIPRDSLLTELLQINHIQTIYNIFVAVLMLLFLNTLLSDFVETGKLNLDFGMMKFAFGKVQTVLFCWVVMKFTVIVILFPVFHYWAHNRLLSPYKKQMDYLCLLLYIIFLGGLTVYPLHILIQEEMPPASSFIILAEQMRLIMKSHAFVRENVPRALRYKPHQDGNEECSDTPCPDFGKFLYFLFIPTLIYRDTYPRSPCIRWKYVATNFLQVIACLFYIYYIFERFCVPVFRRFGQEQFTPEGFLLTVFGSMMPGTLVLLIGFFALLHSWMNAFAEMLRFADRMFYRDWWNSTSFANYYRTWNVVVHDWLYTYIYKDIYKLVGTNRLGPMFVVFILSALVHEYIMTFAFRFFYPILLLMFGGIGVFFVFLTNKKKSRSWNVFMWVALFIGTGLLMSLYSMEWYARLNCPSSHRESFLDYFVPRSWTCN